MRVSLLAICAALLAASPVHADIVDARAAWPAACPLPHQGGFLPNVVNQIDCSISTAIFPGLSVKPIQRTYGANTYCYFIDNGNAKTYFLPLKTESEWLSFYNRFKTDSASLISFTKCGAGCASTDKPVISYVIDKSTSIGPKNYEKVKTFFANMIDALDYTGTEPSNAVFFGPKVLNENKMAFTSLSPEASAALKKNYEDERLAKAGKTVTEQKSISNLMKAERAALRATAGYDLPTKTQVATDTYNPAGHGTAIGTALNKAVDGLKDVAAVGSDGKPLDKMIVLFTDGKNNTGDNLKKATEKVALAGIKTFVVGVGDVEKDELTMVAKAGLPAGQAEGSNYRQLEKFTDMDTAFDTVASGVCSMMTREVPTP